MLVADISCDVNGSVEMLERTTNIDSPYFQYDPIVKREVSGSISSDGVTVMGVDILPTELPRESSIYFGGKLLPVLEKLIDYKFSGEGSSERVPPELVSLKSVVIGRSFMDSLSVSISLDQCLYRDGRFVDSWLSTFGELSQTTIR
jgi:hypothetical protein